MFGETWLVWVFSLVPLLLAAVVGLVVWVVVRQSRRGPSLAPGPVAPPAPGAAPGGSWTAQVTTGSGWVLMVGGHGAVHVHDGWLSFVPDGSPSPAWQVPVASVTAKRRSTFLNGDVGLTSEATGDLVLTVSREHINRAVDNGFKTLREDRYAGEFLQVLAAGGARVSW